MKTKAAVAVGVNKFNIQEIDLPPVQSGDLLLKVHMTSICASDPFFMRDTYDYTFVPGHEMVGWVSEIGEDAKKSYNVDVGDYVTVEPYVLCGKCKPCLTGYYANCVISRGYGVPKPPQQAIPGSYAEYVHVVEGSKIHKISGNASPASGCLSSVLGNGLRWVKTKAKVSLMQSVVIMGAGAQGLSSLVVAKLAGADPIIVVGLKKDKIRLDLALELGANHVIYADEEDVVARVAEITGGEMADVSIDVSGSHAGTVNATKVLRTNGIQVQAGNAGGPTEYPFLMLLQKEITMIGGVGQAWNVEDAVKIINAGKIPYEKLITHTYTLDQVQEAYDFFISNDPSCIRVGVICNEQFD